MQRRAIVVCGSFIDQIGVARTQRQQAARHEGSQPRTGPARPTRRDHHLYWAATAPAAPAPSVKQQLKVQATTATKTDAPASAAPSENRISSLNELPEDIRRQLLALTISGSSYSENPEHRMLIVNGQVFHEGEKPTAELVREQIKPNAAVLSFRGYRCSPGYWLLQEVDAQRAWIFRHMLSNE